MNTVERQQYMIHQIQFTSEERTVINSAGGHEGAMEALPRYKAYLDTMSFGSERFTSDMFHNWRHVATITASGLEDVFCVSNSGNFEDQIERISSMHSLSVGDIVQLGGLFWMVEPCGFKEIEVKEVRFDVTVTSPTEGRPDITMATMAHNEVEAGEKCRLQVARDLDANVVNIDLVRVELYVFCEAGYLPEGF